MRKKKQIEQLKKRLNIIETVFSQKVLKVDIRHLEHTDRFEVVAMFHIENRTIFSELDYYQMHIDINTVSGRTAFEYFARDLKRGITEKMSQLLCDGQLEKQIKIYINHPMKVKS